MRGWGLFFFLFFLLLIFAAIGWVVFTQLRARRAGLAAPTWKSYIPFMKWSSSTSNYPTPRSAGPLEWIKDMMGTLRGGGSGRTARGAYEETSGEGGYAGSGGRRARGVEDDAWDTRVGGRDEDPYGAASGGYGYEEQELGLAPTPGLVNEPYSGGSDYLRGDGGGGYADERARGSQNPFGDQNEAASLRSVSPRPELDGSRGHKGGLSLDSADGSPTGTRKSAFREGI